MAAISAGPTARASYVMRCCGRLAAWSLCLLSCNRPPEPAPAMSAIAKPNQALLEEVDRQGGWFHARKTKPIFAKLLDAPQTVRTLEGEEQVDAGNFLCRGEIGELWPQAASALEKRYLATDEVAADGWRKYVPRPDAQGVMAAQIPHAFTVEAQWGRLTGKPGDYLLKNYQDRDVAYPEDVWIVDRKLFEQTYAAVAPES